MEGQRIKLVKPVGCLLLPGLRIGNGRARPLRALPTTAKHAKVAKGVKHGLCTQCLDVTVPGAEPVYGLGGDLDGYGCF